MNWLIRFFEDERGATAGEYALIVSLIAVAIILGATAVGISINGLLSNASSHINSAS
jgi:pilus assembly protein Flp/PilA